MIIAPSVKPIAFEDFFAQYSDDDRYELIDGEIFDLEPKGLHEEVAAFIDRKLNVQIDNLDLDYFVLQRGLFKPFGALTAFRPDIMVIDKKALIDEPMWERQSVITQGHSIRLIAEVVSSNWQNDYARKMEDYASLGIPEYWIVDYAALGGERFIGKPKEPTLTLCKLIDGRYQDIQMRGQGKIICSIFPNLNVTAEQILEVGMNKSVI